MSEYDELNCPGCGKAMSVHNCIPEWFEQLCPICVRKFTIERWRVAAKRVAKQAADAKKAEEKKPEAEKPETSTDLAG